MTPQETAADNAAFAQWLTFALDKEGRYYENVSGDEGGPTKWGITWIDGNEWRKQNGLPPMSRDESHRTRLAYLTEEIIKGIYYRKYWLKMRALALPSPLDEVVVDCAVNCGLSRSTIFLQRALGIADDGIFGDATETATLFYIKKHGQEMLVQSLLRQRATFYNQIGAPGKTNNKFLRGWLDRVKALGVLAVSVLRPSNGK